MRDIKSNKNYKIISSNEDGDAYLKESYEWNYYMHYFSNKLQPVLVSSLREVFFVHDLCLHFTLIVDIVYYSSNGYDELKKFIF